MLERLKSYKLQSILVLTKKPSGRLEDTNNYIIVSQRWVCNSFHKPVLDGEQKIDCSLEHYASFPKFSKTKHWVVLIV